VETAKKVVAVMDRQKKKGQLLCLVRKPQVLKLSRRHFCFYEINDTSLKRHEYLERKLLFIDHT
jgi:hypothetical protein